MRAVREATLLTDGSSDTALLPLLRWLLAELDPAPWSLQWADLRGLSRPPKGLAERIRSATALFPCELLFVHRDAEREPPEVRVQEIAKAAPPGPSVPVVPVRMQEAWLLHNPQALRQAAGNPRGEVPLHLPPLAKVEALPDPKEVLHRALLAAAASSGRRARGFRPETQAHRLAEQIDDWSPLRQLPAFRRLEDHTRAALAGLAGG